MRFLEGGIGVLWARRGHFGILVFQVHFLGFSLWAGLWHPRNVAPAVARCRPSYVLPWIVET